MKLNSSTIVQLVITSVLIIGGTIFYSNNNSDVLHQRKMNSIQKDFIEESKQYKADQVTNSIYLHELTEQILIEKGLPGTSGDYRIAEKLAVDKIKKQYNISDSSADEALNELKRIEKLW